jgi:hypothetical protein
MMKKLLGYTVLILLFTSSLSFAGNPLYVNGDPLVWDTSQTIKYKIDLEGLGELSLEQTYALIEEATKIWEDVSGTGIEFEFVGTLDEKITLDNWEDTLGNHIYAEGYGNMTSTQAQSDHLLVFAFDNTGEILEAKNSAGASGVQSHTGVLGTYEDPQYIISGNIVLNGLYINDNESDTKDLSSIDMLAIIVHEIGHALGLDHSSSHYQMYRDIVSGKISTDYARYLPTMFPRFIKNSGNHLVSLHPDDISTLKWMYGAGNYITVSGEILDADDNPQISALVSVRNTDSSLCQTYSQVTGVLCSDLNTKSNGKGDDYFTGKYCMDNDEKGFYEIPVLDEQGTYTVDVQELNEGLKTAITKITSSYQSLPGDAEFFNDDDDNNEDPDDLNVLIIDDDDISHIDIVLSDTQASTGDDDELTYDYFIEDDFFSTLEDPQCPSNPDFDIDAVFANASEISNDTSSGSTSVSCALNTADTTKPNINLILLGLFLITLTSIRQLCNKRSMN